MRVAKRLGWALLDAVVSSFFLWTLAIVLASCKVLAGASLSWWDVLLPVIVLYGLAAFYLGVQVFRSVRRHYAEQATDDDDD